MFLGIIIVAALLALVFGRKTAQSFLGGAFFLVGLAILMLFGLGIAMYVLDSRPSEKRGQAHAQQAGLLGQTEPTVQATPPAATPKISAEDERLFRQVNENVKGGKGPRTDREWDAALAPYAGR